MNDVVPQSDTAVNQTPIPPKRSWRSLLLKVIGVSLIVLAVLLLYFGGIAYWAWNSGEALRLEQIQQSEQQERAHQFELAQDDVSNGRYELALRRLDWLLSRDAQYPGAADLQTEAQSQLNLLLTPTVTPSPTITPSPTPEVMVEATIDTAAIDEQIETIEELVDDRSWETAVKTITDLQIDYPSYRRQETDTLLYEAYSGWGVSLLNTEQIEMGLFYLEQARDLGTLPEWIEGEIVFAELYLEGIVFYRVNWGAYLYYFRELCTYAPNFQNSCKLLNEGLLGYGDQLANSLDWCPAQTIYLEAAALGNTPDEESLTFKIEQAETACLSATPTPEAAVISDTVPITNTIPTNP